MKTIIDLMRIDLMGFKAKKSGGMKAAIVIWTIIVLACAVLAFSGMALLLAAPMAFCLIMTVNIIVQNEIKQEYGKTFCIVPADRKSVVIARFTLVTIICTIVAAAFFIFMKIATRFDFLTKYTFNYNIEDGDDGFFPPMLSNIIFGFSFMISCIVTSKKLKKLFRFGHEKKHTHPIVPVLTSIGMVLLMELGTLLIIFAKQIPFIGKLVSVIFAMFAPLAVPMEGMLLTGMFVIFGYAMMIYQAVCSVIYYSKREL